MGRAAEQANTALPKGGGRHLHPLKLAKKDLITLAKCLPDGTGLLPSPQRQPSSSEQTSCSNNLSDTHRTRDPERSLLLQYLVWRVQFHADNLDLRAKTTSKRHLIRDVLSHDKAKRFDR